MDYCSLCVNKEHCDECDKGWKDKFIPPENIKKYFIRVCAGTNRGINGMQYRFNTINRSLKPTHSISIFGYKYCPYCCTKMAPIQDYLTLKITGYCCLCQGALDELEYNEKRAELEKKHKEELNDLKTQYADKLAFDRVELFRIKQEKELELFKDHSTYKYNHFSTYYGDKLIDDIDQIR